MRTKQSTLAGTWYPGRADELRRTVDGFLAETSSEGAASPLGLIVPHAGYQYSGLVAGAAYRRLRNVACTRVVLLAPSHRMSYRGVVVPDVDAFETPLGQVRLDGVVPDLPRDQPLVRIDLAPFQGEHSLEIQLPFVQRVLPSATVVPLLFGDLESQDHPALRPTIDRLADDRTVFVISSDFTHYGWRFGYEPFPADDAATVRDRLGELDRGAIDPILRGDALAFRRYLDGTGATVCGQIPIMAFLTWVDRRHRGELLAYRTSLDVTGDYEHSVSYAAIAFTRAGIA